MKRNLYSAQQVRAMDQLAIEQFGFTGSNLMDLAGQRAWDWIQTNGHSNGSGSGSGNSIAPLVVLCGPGNNGGDGYVVAHCALLAGQKVGVVALDHPKTQAAKGACERYLKAGGEMLLATTANAATIAKLMSHARLIVDGLLGSGLDRAPMGQCAQLINLANSAKAEVLALDIASGLNADTGAAYSPCIKAFATVTFIAQKLGLYTGQGKAHSGMIALERLDLPKALIKEFEPIARLSHRSLKHPLFSSRPVDSHKGLFGHVSVVGGGDGMLGATLLAGKAAMRCGSGLVTLLSTDKHMGLATVHCPELMTQCIENTELAKSSIARSDVVILGPGLGRTTWSQKAVNLALQFEGKMVVDADGLFYLSQSGRYNDQWILTPHPGEAAQLLGCTASDVQKDRVDAAKAIAKRYGGVCVLKGSGTLIVNQKDQVVVCDRGNPGMATAGMGDVLSGIIGALLGQGFSTVEAAEIGVSLHARSADAAAKQQGELSLMASDVINALPAQLKAVGKRT